MHLAKLNKEQLENVVEHILHSTKETGAGTLYHRFEEIIEDEVYSIDKEHAKEIVAHMRPYGEMFSMDSVRTMLQSHGVEHSDAHVCIRYYLVMNMYANDSKHVAEEFSIPFDQFCFAMSKSFINDIDADKHKVEKYFTEIATI